MKNENPEDLLFFHNFKKCSDFKGRLSRQDGDSVRAMLAIGTEPTSKCGFLTILESPHLTSKLEGASLG